MKLLTKEIEKRLPKLYETEEIPLEEKEIHAKFFTPDASATWYVVEGEPEGDDFVFFGYADLGYGGEWGFFTLNQLKSVRGVLGLPVERDLHFGIKKVKEVPEIKW